MRIEFENNVPDWTLIKPLHLLELSDFFGLECDAKIKGLTISRLVMSRDEFDKLTENIRFVYMADTSTARAASFCGYEAVITDDGQFRVVDAGLKCSC